MSLLLELSGIVKQFTGTLALDRVDLEVRSGEIHALLGQNGAGKSTLIKILAGIYPPTSGVIRWRGNAVDPTSVRLPITFIHQDLGLVDSMTVSENIALLTGYPRHIGMIDWHGASQAAVAALETMESSIDPEARVGSISAAEKSIVAIARALARRSDLLVLDEPTAALPAGDVDHLLDKLKRLRASGIGLLYVTHRLDEVFRIADRVTILRDGRKVATRTVSETSSADLVSWIVGGALAETTIASPPKSDGSLLSIKDLVVPQESGAGLVGPLSFEIHPGETLALVGLRGAGHHAVGRAIYGALPVYSGKILFEGHELKIANPADAIRRGIGFVSSRRAEESLAPTIGVDIGSKAEIYRDLRIADERGRAVLLISSDFDEVEKVSHRALVFSRGRLTAEIDRKNINVANLTDLLAVRHLNRARGHEPIEDPGGAPQLLTRTSRLGLELIDSFDSADPGVLNYQTGHISDLF
jgi:ribose transport system ATP-binding protein